MPLSPCIQSWFDGILCCLQNIIRLQSRRKVNKSKSGEWLRTIMFRTVPRRQQEEQLGLSGSVHVSETMCRCVHSTEAVSPRMCEDAPFRLVALGRWSDIPPMTCTHMLALFPNHAELINGLSRLRGFLLPCCKDWHCRAQRPITRSGLHPPMQGLLGSEGE